MSQNIDEIKQSVKGGDNSNLQVLLVILSVVVASIFIGETLFGKNSLEVYLSLKENKKEFAKKIDKIQHENAALQKEYFELKSLLPKDTKN